ncbi:Pyrethroid hydrolase [Ralstonia edaphis]|uniref:alpha/beta fold hydrolase n=1 Tax=Ralstonia edaphi TaxID=3058599 RepID=UPI0028F5A187|nr:alpha/beta fold hydrolase [Ralstonia sp. LMG 6871]CAJ0720850.1 Pyrethroid hydrolase [Ralstonia sp. LMG 6871]
MNTFVLVHGSWHDGGTWAPVAENLRAKGYVVHTPTIAGHGHGANRNVTHAQCTQSIVDYVLERDLTDFVLVGHSYGGTIISKVAEAVPERIHRLVFWNAFVLKDGDSLLDTVPPSYLEMFSQLAAASGDNSVAMPWPVWREAFMNDGDLAIAKRTYEMLTPEPFQPFADKLDLKKFYSLDIPKSYLNCTEDTALPHGEYGWHPRLSSRLGHFRLVQMPGGHEVMFTNPAGLAEKLVEAGRD